MIETVQRKLKRYLIVDQAFSSLANRTKQTAVSGLYPLGPTADTRTGVLFRPDPMDEVHSLIRAGMNWTICGASAVSATGVMLSSPSSVPWGWEYVEQLQTDKRNLETRVQSLEVELKEMRTYWPTVRRLIQEHTAAADRVASIVRGLSAKQGSRGALEIARKCDRLERPLDEHFEEIE
jgi:hypothetical protein